MDIFTQGLLGATLAQSVSDKHHARLATLTGFIAGLVADSDAFITSGTDPLLYLEYHRHFTHSLAFIPVGALIAFLLLLPFLYKKIQTGHLTKGRLYLFCLAGYSLSGFIDACTSYGTLLLWPFSDERIAFSIISIVDPVFTGALLIGVSWTWFRRRRQTARLAFMFCGMYLLLGLLQHQRAVIATQDLAQARGHTIKQMTVKPTLGNLLLWRSVYISDNRIHVDAQRVGLNRKIYEGVSVPSFSSEAIVDSINKDSVIMSDIARFTRFSDGYIAMDPYRPNVLGDMRYSLLPTSASSLWGITLDWDRPDEHTPYRFYRENTRETRAEFIRMLKGE